MPVKPHLRWIIPLALVPVLYFGSLLAGDRVRALPDYEQNLGLLLLNLILVSVGPLGALAALVLAVVNGIRAPFRARAARAAAAQSNAGWAAAQSLRETLSRGERPPTIRVWEIVAYPGEVMYCDVVAEYARYYGQAVSYEHRSGFFFGHPAFVVAGLAATAIGNSANRAAARSAARVAWREWQQCRVIVTDQRLMCHVNGEWLSFHFSAMTAVYPEADRWSVVCQFGGGAAPLLLSGPNIPTIAVLTVLQTHGREAVASHPSLQTLG